MTTIEFAFCLVAAYGLGLLTCFLYFLWKLDVAEHRRK
jgi:hypothetical protein